MTVDLDDLKSQVELLRWIAAQREKCNDELKDLAEKEKDALAEVQDAMKDEVVGTVDGKPAVEWTHHSMKQLDQKRLAKELPNVSKAYKRDVPYRKFRVVE